MDGAKRRVRPTGDILEVREAELAIELTELFLFDYNSKTSSEELRELSRRFKKVLDDYTFTIVQYVDHYRSNGATSEASDLINSLNIKRISYRDTIKKIHQRREELLDDNISSLSSSKVDSLVEGASALSTTAKVP